MADPKSRFLLLFSAILAASFALISVEVVNRELIEPFTGGVALAGAAALRAVGEPVDVYGTVIRGQDFAVNVRNGCNGLEAISIFVAALLAHPRRSLLAALAGALALEFLNVLRVAGLYLIGLHALDWFDLSHTVVAQTAMAFLAITLFLLFVHCSQPARS